MSTPSTVLVVDDDRVMRLMLTDALKLAGYRVVTAATTADFPALARDVQPDVILLDLMIAPYDGWDTRAQLRQAGSTVPIILMSATVPHHRENERAIERVSRGDSFIAKPIHMDTLLKIVAREVALGPRGAA